MIVPEVRTERMKAFITGATGFLGSHLVDELVKRGWEIRCLVRKKVEATYETVSGDLTERGTLKPEYFKDIDVVFHLAAQISARGIKDYFKVNVEGTKNLVDAILSSRPSMVRKIVFVSSLAVHGPGKVDGTPIKEDDPFRPITPYGESKKRTEELLLLVKDLIKVVIVRPTIVVGPRNRLLLPLYRFAPKFGCPIIPGHIVSFVHVRDVVNVLIESAEHELNSGEAFLVSDGKAYTYEDLWDILNSIFLEIEGRKIRKIPTFNFMPRVLSILPGIIGRRAKEMAEKNWFCTPEKTRKILGINEFIPARESIREDFFWCKSTGLL